MSEYQSRFDPRMFGGNYEPESEPKMRSNLDLIREFMTFHPGVWMTKEQIRKGAGLEAGTDVTPRLRDLRKPRFGGWAIDMQYIDEQYRYRLRARDSRIINEKEDGL